MAIQTLLELGFCHLAEPIHLVFIRERIHCRMNRKWIRNLDAVVRHSCFDAVGCFPVQGWLLDVLCVQCKASASIVKPRAAEYAAMVSGRGCCVGLVLLELFESGDAKVTGRIIVAQVKV